jgi:uncharacterized cupredoxin-like copper-binding protein
MESPAIPKPARIVQIVMREVRRQDAVLARHPHRASRRADRFQLRNNGEVDHEFVVGTVEENLKHMKEMEKIPTWSTTIPMRSV